MGDLDRAVADFTDAIRINPKHDEAHRFRALVYDDQGKYDAALADWTRAIEIDPKDANYFNGRCWTRAISGRDLQLALADCAEVAAD